MATVMLFLQQTTGKTERHTHFCMPLEPVFTRDCGGRVHFTDEPTGALDSRTGRMIMDIFHRLNQEQKKTIVLITHSQELAEETGRIVTLKDGEVVGERRGTGC